MREAVQRGASAAAWAGTIAAVLYAGVGLADAASHSASASRLGLVALIYAAVGILASAATLGCIRAIRCLQRKPIDPGYEGTVAAIWAAVGLLAGYGVVSLNRYLLVDYPWFSPVAIVITAAFCVAAVLFGLLLFGFIARRLEQATSQPPPVLTRATRWVPLLILALAALSLRPEEHTFPTRPRGSGDLPNVVVMVSDCVRADHVSAYGYERETTPLFDRMAGEGMLFKDAHASASWTLPSVTGLLASTRAGIDVRPGVSGTELNASTLPEVLTELGYVTYAASNNPHLGGRFGVGSRFDAFDPGTTAWERALDATMVGLVRRRLFLIDDGTMVDRTIGALDNLSEPFFIYLHVMGGHSPYEHPSSYEPAFPIPRTDHPITGPHSGMTISDAQRANLVARYDVMVRYADDQLARFVDSLAARNDLDDTVLVYTADHGEEFGDHGKWEHGRSLHLETVRVPLVIRWPGHIPAGARRSDLASLLDLGPSIMGLLPENGVEAPDNWQGVDLQLTEAAPQLAHRAALSELGPSLRALTTPDWKYVIDVSDGSVQLYDRRVDPDETRDVANEEPEVLEELAGLLRAELEGGDSALAPSDEAVPADPALVEQLRALGYVD
jgi:arylsulfatase A-like enzyme